MNKLNLFGKTVNAASSTAKKWDNERCDSTVQSKTCPQCGAPRPKNTNISYCSYCRYNFMAIDVNISDKHE